MEYFLFVFEVAVVRRVAVGTGVVGGAAVGCAGSGTGVRGRRRSWIGKSLVVVCGVVVAVVV